LLLLQYGCQRPTPAKGHALQPNPPAAASPESANTDAAATSPEIHPPTVAAAPTKTCENKRYGFRVVVPADWKVAVEPKGLLPQGESEGVVFELPPVWSALENTSIRNAVSVKAIRPFAASTAVEFAAGYSLVESDGRISSQPVEGFARPAYVEEVNWRGLTYKRRLEFEIQHGIVYVLEFTATPGTFDQNYSKFRQVADTVEFFAPSSASIDTEDP